MEKTSHKNIKLSKSKAKEFQEFPQGDGIKSPTKYSSNSKNLEHKN